MFQKFRPNGLRPSQTNHTQPRRGAPLHEIVHCNVRVTGGENRPSPAHPAPQTQYPDGHGRLTRPWRPLDQCESVRCSATDGHALTRVHAFDCPVFFQGKSRGAPQSIIIFLSGIVPTHRLATQRGGPDGARPSRIPGTSGGNSHHRLRNIFVHRRYCSDQLLRGSTGVSAAAAVAWDVGGSSDNTRCLQLAVETHAVGKLVNAVDISGRGV
mmetsp:Transcript_15323/g.30542  ORF Transcript_15323/g.30542 Transcript_15323/m.30542 type:complete len:212 (-) Transcript_15323:1778-2413(-)